MSKKFNKYNENDSLLEGGDAGPEENKDEENMQKKPDDMGEAEEFEEIYTDCCCCSCVSANNRVEGHNCCCCFGMLCGITTIGVCTVLITTCLFVGYFALYLNETLAWWYVTVALLLLVPTLVASGFVINWCRKDTNRSRYLLWVAQLLMLASIVAVCLWDLCYFCWVYKKPEVHDGYLDTDDHPY